MNEHFFRFPLNTLELEFLHKRFLVSISLHSIWNRRRSVECLCSFPRLPIKVVDTCFEIVDLRPLIVLPTLHLQKQMPNCYHEPVNKRIVSKLETFTYLLCKLMRTRSRSHFKKFMCLKIRQTLKAKSAILD